MPSIIDRDPDVYLEWDVVNWRRSLAFIEPELEKGVNRKALEVGGRDGGMSLLLARYGWQVTCSDLNGPSDKALELHKNHEVSHLIHYAELDIVNPTIDEQFDLVIFKSVMGGVTSADDKYRRVMLDNIDQLLKPGGQLLFLENLSGSTLHSWLRKRFVQWGSRWNYLPFKEVDGLLSGFKSVRYKTFGFIALFGRSESQRRTLGRLDAWLERLVPPSWRYIIAVAAIKGRGHDPNLPKDGND